MNCLRELLPLTEPPGGMVPTRARQLECLRAPVDHARALVGLWHSRLPNTQRGPWMAAYAAYYDGITYAVALWHNPSARTLPSDWLELRRMAVAPDAPHCTASWFLAAMCRSVRRDFPVVRHVISYQDTAVHQGTIYRAAGWQREHVTKARERDRSGNRAGTRRKYRTSLNGLAPDVAEKVRWGYDL